MSLKDDILLAFIYTFAYRKKQYFGAKQLALKFTFRCNLECIEL